MPESLLSTLRPFQPGIVRTNEELAVALRWLMERKASIQFTEYDYTTVIVGRHSINAHDMVSAVVAFVSEGVS